MDRMRLREQARRCVNATRADRYTRHAETIAEIALEELPPGKDYKDRIRRRFREEHPEVSSVFVIFILPLVISLISQWIIRWIWERESSGS